MRRATKGKSIPGTRGCALTTCGFMDEFAVVTDGFMKDPVNYLFHWEIVHPHLKAE